jgi:hypothetical protein
MRFSELVYARGAASVFRTLQRGALPIDEKNSLATIG